MGENIKLQIKNEILKQIMDTVLRYDLNNYTMNYFEEIIDELFDVSKDKILNINEYETYVLRKKFGILDNGVQQLLTSLAKDLNKSSQAISSTINKSIMKFISYSNEMYIIDMIKNGVINSKDIEIKDLDLSLGTYNYLMRKKLFNIGLMCDLSTYEFRNIVQNEKVFQELYNKVHFLSLDFYDERINTKKLQKNRKM